MFPVAQVGRRAVGRISSKQPDEGYANSVRRRAARVLVALITLPMLGCSVVSPPPIAPVHATPAPQVEDTVTISVAVGFSTGVFLDSGAGGELRVEWQDGETRALGVALSGGVNVSRRGRCQRDERAPDPEPRGMAKIRLPRYCSSKWLVAVRTYRVFHLEEQRDHIALHAGGGLGLADGGLLYATLDGGTRFGTDQGEVDVYISPALSLSVPILRGRPMTLSRKRRNRRPSATFYGGFDAGFVFADQKAGGGALSGTWAAGFSLSGEGAVHLGASASGRVGLEPE